jgi:hypothetical protein
MLARLGIGAQLRGVEREETPTSFRSKPLKDMGCFNAIDTEAMPAAASENMPETIFGMDPANRRCSEWRATVGRIAAAPKERPKTCFGRRKKLRTARWPSGFARTREAGGSSDRLEPPGRWEGSPDPDHLPDGTHRRPAMAVEALPVRNALGR